jgi:glycosyltransferase involved in cell wall biosynthesis
MRILIHDYAGHPFTTALSRELARLGHEVAHVFASDLQTPRGDMKPRPTDATSLTFQEVPMDPEYARYKYKFLRRRSMEIGYGKRAGDFIREWKPDAVISGNTPTEAQEPITRATLDVGGRFYYWLQDFYSLAVDKILRKKLPVVGMAVGAYYKFLEGRQFRRSSQIVAITGDFAPILDEEFGVTKDRVAVVPNWALIEELPMKPKDNPWSRKHGLHDKFVFLYSGTIGMKHNPGLLLELAKRFQDHPDVRILVVSEGIGAEWLKKESGGKMDNLIILPYQPFAELPEVLATGDVLVGILEPDAGSFSVPSKTLSYLCSGRPLLLSISQENLAAQITRGEDAGLTVSPEDVEGLVTAARTLYGSAELRQRFGSNARAYAEKTFPITKIAGVFENILSC